MKYSEGQSRNKDSSVKFDFNKITDTRKSQNIQYNEPFKNSSDRNFNRLSSDIETKFDYADEMLKDYLQDNPLNQDNREVLFTLLLLKELLQSKSNEVSRIERDLKMREENLAHQLNELPIDQLEKFSDLVMNKRIDEADKITSMNETGYKLDKIRFNYYFDEIENYAEVLKKHRNSGVFEDKKSEPGDLKRSQTNKNLLAVNDVKSSTPVQNKVNLNNSMVMSKNYENQVAKTTPNDTSKNILKTSSVNPTPANTKINSTTPSNSKTPSISIKTQPSISSSKGEIKPPSNENLDISYTKKPSNLTTSSVESIQNLNNFKNSSSVVKNPSFMDPKVIGTNKSLLHSVENIKKLEEIENDHDKLMLKGDDDLLVESGFDSDKDNQDVYEQKRRERLKNKQNISQNTFEPISETETSLVGESKKKFARSLSNLGPSVRNLKNAKSDSITSITSTPSNKNLTNTVRKINRNGPESKSNSNLDLSPIKEGVANRQKNLENPIIQNKASNKQDELNSSIKMTPGKKIETTRIISAITQPNANIAKKPGNVTTSISTTPKTASDDKIIFQSKLFAANPADKLLKTKLLGGK